LVKSLNKRAASAALMLIVLLLTGCFGGAKTFTVVVQVTPELDGVEIHRGSETGDLLGTTNENGTVELRNVKSNTVLVPVKAGYRFNPASHPVSKAGKIEFTATPKERTVQSAASQADISVLIGTVFGDLPLPAEVEVALSDGSTVDLAVQWQEGTYDPDTAGEYSLEGVLVLTEGISNPDGINAEIRVIVRFVPEEDEPYYEEARSYLDQLIPEYVTEELNLPTRFEVASGAFFDAEWDSSHPDVLSPRAAGLSVPAHVQTPYLSPSSHHQPGHQNESRLRLLGGFCRGTGQEKQRADPVHPRFGGSLRAGFHGLAAP
jgi:hypothetical protein